MKKLFLFLVMMSFMIGFGAMVMASDPWTTNATITPDLTLTPFPNPIGFGSLTPGQSSNLIPITLVPGTSKLSVTVTSVIDDSGLFQNIKFNLGTWLPIETAGAIVVEVNTNRTFDSKLDVPIGFHSGFYQGTITYTVSEFTP